MHAVGSNTSLSSSGDEVTGKNATFLRGFTLVGEGNGSVELMARTALAHSALETTKSTYAKGFHDISLQNWHVHQSLVTREIVLWET